jgi:CpeT protein
MTRRGAIWAIALMLALLMATACTGEWAKVQTGPAGPEGDLALLVSLLSGSFSSQEQATADPSYFDIRLQVVPIWRHRTDGHWLYVEQAVATALERPYRQRVYHVTARPDGTFESAVYSLPNPLQYAGEWLRPEPLAGLTLDQLEKREGCAVILRKVGPAEFTGGTVGTECASGLSGAAYATSEVTISAEGMISWDRGYDTQGNQVWGAEKGGYNFRRVTPGP